MGTGERERALADTAFARELLQQVETLGEPTHRPLRRSRRLLLAAVAGGAAAAALFAGVTFGNDSASHRPAPVTDFASPLSQSPTPYPTNTAGQTYGGAQEGTEADLQSVVATRGENGYCWKSDLEGPYPMTPEEVVWLSAVQSRREVAVYKADAMTQVGIFIVGGGGSSGTGADGTTVTKKPSNWIARQPPAWLFYQMKDLAAKAGDTFAWAWWTQTTAAKAAVATGDAAVAAGDPGRPVYLAIILGDFTNWLWSLPAGATAPQYSWIYEVLDTGARSPDTSGGSVKPFQAATELRLNVVSLRDRIKVRM